jgi:hypothetical protein
MSKWTCASCGQEVASHQPIYKCAVCLQTDAIEDQTRLLRQIHNIPEPVYQSSSSSDDSGTVVVILFFILLFFLWLFEVF